MSVGSLPTHATLTPTSVSQEVLTSETPSIMGFSRKAFPCMAQPSAWFEIRMHASLLVVFAILRVINPIF